MQQVAIIGLGLIGASIGLGLRRWATDDGKRAPVIELTGFDIDLTHQGYAKKIKAVDRTEWNLRGAIERADLIVIATPVGAVREVFAAIGEYGKQGVVVTDTCSTKSAVLSWARELLPSSVHFVGGHPMAGKTQSIEGAEADLFKGATWCVTPLVSASEDAVQTVLGMIAALGAEPLFIDAEEHDSYVAGISHLPFLLSVALMRVVSRDPSWRDVQRLTASGFRDATRLAAGSPEMYRDICATNSTNIARWLDSTLAELQHLRDLIAAGNEETISTLGKAFEEARDARATWATRERRPGELVQDTASELANISFGQQMQQLFFGNLFRWPRPGAGKSPEDSRGKRPPERR
jgi:prephenate dehydrogenase